MAMTPQQKAAAQAVVNGIRKGWTIYGERVDTGDIAPTLDENGVVITPGSKGQPIPGSTVLLIQGPNGQTDEITVAETAGTPGPPTGTSDEDAAYAAAHPGTPAGYAITKGPAKPLKGGADDPQGQTQANDPKGHRISKPQQMPDGSTAMVDFEADGLGNYSIVEGNPPRTYIPAKTDPPAAPVNSTTSRKIPTLRDGKWEWDDNPNYVAPKADKTPNEGLTTGQAAVDAATGANAQASSDTALATAQTQQKTAELALKRAEIDLANAPTSEEAKRAKATAQKGLDLANKGLEAAQAQTAAEGPGRLAQQGATLEQTQAATDASREATLKGKQGDLYGLPDRIKQIRDLIASGEIKPADADASLAAVQRGTDIYTVMKEQAADKEKARTQDITSKNALAGNFASTFNSANNTFQEMNKTGAIGSDATGKAFLATLGLAQDYLKSYEPSAATPTDYLNGQPTAVGGMVNQAQQQLAAVPPPAVVPPPQAAAPATMAPITINVGGAPTPSLLPAGDTGTQRDPMVANSPAQPQPSYMNGAGPGPVNPGGGGVSSLVGAASRAVPAGVADVEADHQAALQRLHGLTGGM